MNYTLHRNAEEFCGALERGGLWWLSAAIRQKVSEGVPLSKRDDEDADTQPQYTREQQADLCLDMLDSHVIAPWKMYQEAQAIAGKIAGNPVQVHLTDPSEELNFPLFYGTMEAAIERLAARRNDLARWLRSL